jgi:hypothetical protein
LARKRGLFPESPRPKEKLARPSRLWPYVGVALGLVLLAFPVMVPSVWAAMSSIGSRDLDISVTAAQGPNLLANQDGSSATRESEGDDTTTEGVEPAGKEILTPEMQSVVFRPTSAVLEGELVTIERRIPSTRRGVRATDTAVRALGRYLATIGYENGRLPASALRRSTTGCRMYAPAAVAYDAMVAAAAEAGFRLEHSGCYRSHQQQVLLRQARCAQNRCKFAAVPGTSMHGWGLAVDFKIGNRALDYRDELFAWLTANAGRFGYVHPYWARQGGNLQEPWHWEYGLLTAGASQSVTAPSPDPATAAIEIGEDQGKLADALASESGSSTGDLEVDVDPDDPNDPDDPAGQTP